MGAILNALGANGIVGLVNGIGSLIGGIGTNYTNQQIANQNIAYQKEANEQNIAFQREINDTNYYRQLAENNLTREREDTAVQRAMTDVTNAGLSKTLATGLSASSSSQSASMAQAPKAEALRNEFKYQSVLKELNLLDMYNKVQESKATVDHIKAQTSNINAQTDFTKTQNDMYAQKTVSEINKNVTSSEYNSVRSDLVRSTSEAEVNRIEAQVKNLVEDTNLKKEQVKQIIASTNKLDGEAKIDAQKLTEMIYDFEIAKEFKLTTDFKDASLVSPKTEAEIKNLNRSSGNYMSNSLLNFIKSIGYMSALLGGV